MQKIIILVESELDSILLSQEIEKFKIPIIAIALGSAQSKPTKKIYEILDSTRILVSLDFDEAGRNSTKFWLKEFPGAVNYPVPEGKDHSDFFQKGGNIFAWVKGGIEKLGIDSKLDLPVRIEKKTNPVVGSPPKIRSLPKIKKELPRTCINGKFCQNVHRLEDKEFSEIAYIWCLINNKNVFRMNACPKKLWVKNDVEW